MRIPLNWLSEYVKLPKDRGELTDKLTMAGHMLDKADEVNGNIVIDLELRGNRADCYSILGIAREVSALFRIPVKYPAVHPKLKENKGSNTTLKIETPLVRRVMMVEINDIRITDSPDWLKEKLIAYGLESINNIVDLTNFVMLETGEPMHAFDLDKIGTGLEIRLARGGEKMTTFLNKTLVLTSEDLVWANKTDILSVAGAIGGKNHSVSGETKNILLEAASYDRANIRKSIHNHNLFTDAGIRHEKDLDPNLVENAVYRFLYLVEKNNWGKINSSVYDYYPKLVKPLKISLIFERLIALSGFSVDKEEIKEILKWLNFEISKKDSQGMELIVPAYRTDVVLEEDVIEEVLRIQSYDKIPEQILSLEIPKLVTPSYINQELAYKAHLSAIGFDEAISSAFIKENYLKYNKPLGGVGMEPVRVENPPSPDAHELRINLFANLLEYTQKVINERGVEVLFFEIGKTYSKKESKYSESRKLGLIYWAKDENNFKKFKGFLDGFFAKANISQVRYVNLGRDLDLINSYQILIDKLPVGIGGQFGNIYYAEIDLDGVLGKEQKQVARLWPKYPPQIEDITLQFPSRTMIGDIINEMAKIKFISDIKLAETYKDSHTFRIWYQDPDKTLTDKEVEAVRNKILEVIKRKFGGTVKD